MAHLRHQPEKANVSHQNLAPYAIVFSPVGIGSKEKREQWVRKDEVKGSKKPQPIAYDCVIRGGPVPTITIRRPIDPTKGGPAQRQLSNATNSPVLERYSSPAIPGHHPQRPPSPPSPLSPLSPLSPRSSEPKSKRESSPLSIEYQPPNFKEFERKPLPALPRIKPASLESEAFDSVFERSFIDGSDSSETGLSTRTFIEAPQRSVRRSFVLNPANATPRTLRTPQIPPQSFENINAPMGLMDDEPLESPWASSSESGPVTRSAPGNFGDALPSQTATFAEYTDYGEHFVPRKPSAPMLDLSSTAPPIPEKSDLRLSSFDEWRESRRARTFRQPSPVAGTSTGSLPATSVPTRTATVRTTASAQARPSTLADVIGLAEAKPVMIYAVVAGGTARLVGS